MTWQDDSWRDSYDAWKLRSPDDEYEHAECHHESFEIDMEGRAHCDDCYESWWATADEIHTQREQQAEYDAWCARQERRVFWLRLTHPVRWTLHLILQKVWPRKSMSVLADEEIPF